MKYSNKKFYKLSKLFSLDDTLPFIDYIQLYTPEMPTNVFYSIMEDGNRGVIIPHYPNDYKCVYNDKLGRIQIVCHDDGLPTVRITLKENKDGNYCSCWVHVPSYPIPHNLNRAIDNIHKISQLRARHDIFHNGLLMADPRSWSISRLDLSINIQSSFALGGIDFVKYNNPKLNKYYDVEDGCKVLSGVVLGRRGTDAIQLKVYKKWLDPSQDSALKKYGCTNFYRMEYSIGHKKLGDIPLSTNSIGKFGDDLKYERLDRLCFLDVRSIYDVWLYCIGNKSPLFPKLERPDRIPAKPQLVGKSNKHQILYDQVKGIVSSNWFGASAAFELLCSLNMLVDELNLPVKTTDVKTLLEGNQNTTEYYNEEPT